MYLPRPIPDDDSVFLSSNVAFVVENENDIKTVPGEIVSIQLLCQDTLVLAGPVSPSLPDVLATSTV